MDRVVKSRSGDDAAIPEVLLKTVAMTVNASVPPNGKAIAMREMMVAIWFGKKPTAWREPENETVSRELLRKSHNS